MSTLGPGLQLPSLIFGDNFIDPYNFFFAENKCPLFAPNSQLTLLNSVHLVEKGAKYLALNLDKQVARFHLKTDRMTFSSYSSS
jgi:hypothetical protein